MEIVYRLWPQEPNKFYKTQIWITEKALSEFAKYQKTEQPPKCFIKKLKRYSENGFEQFEGDKAPIRHEWNGVYRIGDNSLFRLYGFYEDDSRKDFIIIKATKKRGTQLSRSERALIDNIAKIKRDGAWTKILATQETE